MPELPEIETIKCGIQPLVGQSIQSVIIRNFALRYPIAPSLINSLRGKQILSIKRRAKYLLIQLDDGYLIIHLGMSGSLTLVKPKDAVKKHDHVDIIFANFILRYNDPRRFGCLLHTQDPHNHPLLNRLGLEPLDNQFTSSYLLAKLKNKATTIKQLIMDNQIVVGVGNIYACEALFLAQIAPTRKGATLSLFEAENLVSAIKQVLTVAIQLGGSTLRDYKRADGKLGSFQTIHKVYGKAGNKCLKCSNIILEQRLGQRNSFYCPYCQK